MNNVSKIGLDCVGCRSCEQSCVKSCIEMKENKEGFIYPLVDDLTCISCGICLKRCPVYSGTDKYSQPLEVFALKSKDKSSIYQSASGGAADLAAKVILERHGVVYGAAYTNDLKVQHICITSNEERVKLQSSKYVQSDLNDCFTKVKKQLISGKLVLFTGVPCQVEGLYSFLGKEYENLYTLDLICHGVPSQKFLDKYLAYQEKCIRSKILYINFRSKDKRGWGTQYLLKTRTETRAKTRTMSLDKYGKHFMEGDCYRESCYRCRYANTKRVGDLTVGDFWGIDKCHPEFSSTLGVSSMFVNSEKGRRLLMWLGEDAETITSSLQNAMIKQGNLIQPTTRPKSRDIFYSHIDEEGFIDKLKIGLQVKERVKAFFPRWIVVKLKKYSR